MQSMDLDNIQRQLDENHPVDPADIQALVRFARKGVWGEIRSDGHFEMRIAGHGWISVEDRLPEEDGAYLCADSSDDIYVAYRFPSIDGAKAYFNGMIDDKPKYLTHWQHLPSPPSDD